MNGWASQWKMSFNLDPIKQAQKGVFSRKIKKISHPPLNFNNDSVSKYIQYQKHLGVYLDNNLDFCKDLWNLFKMVSKTISLLRKLQNNLPGTLLVTIYKFFVRPHLDFEDILYDHTFINSFHEKLELIQYNAALAITGAIRSSSGEKLYQELGFKSLQQQQWDQKLCPFFKIIIKKHVPGFSLN